MLDYATNIYDEKKFLYYYNDVVKVLFQNNAAIQIPYWDKATKNNRKQLLKIRLNHPRALPEEVNHLAELPSQPQQNSNQPS